MAHLDIPSNIFDLVEEHGTPLWVYDSAQIVKRVEEMKSFDVIRYAQKANSNLAILSLLKSLGVCVDAVTAGEIYRALKVGFSCDGKHPGIVYTADLVEPDALALIAEHKIPVNIGSPNMLQVLAEAKIDVPITLRINPGFGHGHSNKTNTGGESSKHGIWHEQLEDVLATAKRNGQRVVGLHMHIGSGSDFEHLSRVCDAMVAAAQRFAATGMKLEVVSAGGGLPIPYRPEGTRLDTVAYYKIWDAARKRIEEICGHPITLEVEPGRYLVADSGILVARVQGVKTAGSNRFVLCNAGFSDLVRPAFYGSYHHISAVSKLTRQPYPRDAAQAPTVVAGPLCESGDVFTQTEGGVVEPRPLPADLTPGDLLVLHTAGAYGATMSSNYNSRVLAAELLLQNGTAYLVRRRQPVEDLVRYDVVPPHLQQ